ncbi:MULTISPECIES: C40 family peptidase [Aquimarina]|nr:MULTISPECIES: NlpC/P60 family protein [Aquimarina]
MITRLLGLMLVLVIVTSVNCKGVKPTQDSDIVVTYDSIVPKIALLPVQIKYGKLLNIKPDSLQNVKLYTFIDDWINTPYKSGGETKDGIDASSFTQLLYTKVFDKYIERTAEKQFESGSIRKFRGKEFLQEGDFIFFQAENKAKINHVGVFLKNNNFVHATYYKGESGARGVKISNLDSPYWTKRFVAGGKRLDM